MKKLLFLSSIFISINLFALSTEAKLDMLKIKLTKQLKSLQYKKAIVTMNSIKKLAIRVPKSFSFFEGKALFESGDKAASYKKFEEYVDAFGKQGKYYIQSINYLVEAEDAMLIEKNNMYNQSEQKELLKKEKNRIYVEKETQLMWQDNLATKNRSYEKFWYEAKQYCKNIVLNNYNDWRLPTKDELINLYKDYTKLKYLSKYSYWSSSEFNNDNTKAWLVRQYSIKYEDKTTYTYQVRCVRNIQ